MSFFDNPVRLGMQIAFGRIRRKTAPTSLGHLYGTEDEEWRLGENWCGWETVPTRFGLAATEVITSVSQPIH